MTDIKPAIDATNLYDVLVVGGDAASLIAALDCARIGLRVAVLALPTPHHPAVFSNRGGVVASLLTELDVAFVVEDSPIAQGSIVGIPANPFAPQIRQKMGWGGAWRLYADRITPLLTIGTETNLGALVRRRLGAAAVTALVDPELHKLYGRGADEVSVAAVVPGLNQAMTRAGSLTTAIIELIITDPRLSQTLVVEDGITHVEAVLRQKLEFFAADIIDITDVHLTLNESSRTAPDELPSFAAAFAAAVSAAAAPTTIFAHALLVNPDVATVPEGAPAELAGEVGICSWNPGLESAAPASRAQSAVIRSSLLRDPKRLPLGPLSLEG